MTTLPCPFCGCSGVHTHEGSTFRWLVAECNNCGATASAARINTLANRDEALKKAEIDAIEEWNTRYEK